jgi:hypothetical protein
VMGAFAGRLALALVVWVLLVALAFATGLA